MLLERAEKLGLSGGNGLDISESVWQFVLILVLENN